MFAIFRKRAEKLSKDFDKLQKQATALVMRAQAHIEESHRAIDVLQEEIVESQFVIEAISDGSVLD
jgi:hypothetical protein